MEQMQSQVVKALREGIDIVKMVLFRKLKEDVSKRCPDRQGPFANMMAGAVINNLFQVTNDQEPFAAFFEENRALIEEETVRIATNLKEMRIPLTDALRTQVLCDDMEGMDSGDLLIRADQLGILIKDRAVPFPNSFLKLAYRLGTASGLLKNDSLPEGGTYH